MKKSLPVLSLLLLANLAAAKDKMLPLSEEAGVLMLGQTVTVTRHEKPTFIAMTAGKGAFGLLGVAAMASAGNAIVKENEIADPADIVENELVGAVIKHFGLQRAAGPAQITKADSTKELLALKVDTNYLLDVRSTGWNFTYYPSHWGKYWVGYSVQLKLIDKGANKLVSNMACNSSTNQHEPFPTRKALLADRAQLLKDVTSALGWMCVQLLATEQFHLPQGSIAATPRQFLDPARDYLAAHPGAYDEPEEEK